MVLGDAFSKLETFVWILNRISRCITKSIILGQLINLNMIFRVVEKLVWGETRPSPCWISERPIGRRAKTFPTPALLAARGIACHKACAHSHASMLSSFPTVFEEKKDCSQSTFSFWKTRMNNDLQRNPWSSEKRQRGFRFSYCSF